MAVRVWHWGKADMADTAQDDDTTATSGEVDPQTVSEDLSSGKDPNRASLTAQHAFNAQQRRAILQRAPTVSNSSSLGHISTLGETGALVQTAESTLGSLGR
jgi:hypothetical protein